MTNSAPVHVVVMGVAGTGKTTVGRRLADHLRRRYVEGDDHHPPENVAKMAAGTPLTDEDRRPWLDELAAVLAGEHAAGRGVVLGCSALRRPYRDRLRGGLPPRSLLFVHLDADRAVLERRMAGRRHFMPTALLDSQLDTLEPLGRDECGARVDVAAPLDNVVEAAVRLLREEGLDAPA